jgi:two-component system, LytTR family, sensor kinase
MDTFFDNFMTRNRRWNRLLWHSVFWLFFTLIYSSRITTIESDFWNAILQSVIFMPVVVAGTYFTTGVLFRKHFYKQKFMSFAVLFVISGIGFTLFSRFISYTIVVPYFYPQSMGRFQLFNPIQFIANFFSLYFIIAFAVIIILMSDWFKNEKLKDQVLKEKVATELQVLKSQIHPHFLFNTLNNLYGLILKGENDLALATLLKISSMLDYMLHEANAPTVALRREIEIIEDYIALERIRYGDRIHIAINKEGDFNGKVISPLLIFPFVENSFKHGTSESLENPWIDLSIAVIDNRLKLKLENSKSQPLSNQKREHGGGIGISNVRKRLDLLYNGSYDLKISDEERRYTVVLKLNLGSLKHL